MEFGFQIVSKEDYDDGRENRIKAASLQVGSLCTLRQISPGLKKGFAIDANVRIATIDEPGEDGLRLVEAVVVDLEGNDLTKNGMALHCQTMMGADDFLYDDAIEEGYFPADPWDMSNLDNFTATVDDMQAIDLTRTLVTV